jgi:hypothetical protein
MHNPSLPKRVKHMTYFSALILCVLMSFFRGAQGAATGCTCRPANAHPFHAGLAELHIYDTRLELAIRVFTDDLEMMMSKRFRKDVDLTLGDSAVNSWLLQTLSREEVGLQSDSNWVGLDYVGCEREDDSIWLFLEQDALAPGYLNWMLKLTLLSQLFPEQRFVVSINQNGRSMSQLLAGPDFLIRWSVD